MPAPPSSHSKFNLLMAHQENKAKGSITKSKILTVSEYVI